MMSVLCHFRNYARQKTVWRSDTDITLTPVTDALLGFAAPRTGERVVDIGCGCGAPTLEFARAVGPSGRVVGFDISGPMLAEGERRASAASLANVDWRQVDPATAALDEYDLLTSAFGTMFFGDSVAAFTNNRSFGRDRKARNALYAPTHARNCCPSLRLRDRATSSPR